MALNRFYVKYSDFYKAYIIADRTKIQENGCHAVIAGTDSINKKDVEEECEKLNNGQNFSFYGLEKNTNKD